MYKIDQAGDAFIESKEGCILHPYKDVKGVPTIGIGSTFYENGSRVTMSDPSITRERAEAIFNFQIANHFMPAIVRLVKVPLNQNQVNALVSFVYNLGVSKFTGSTLLRKLNGGIYSCADIKAEFNKWVYVNGERNSWQITRRKDEGDLFCS